MNTGKVVIKIKTNNRQNYCILSLKWLALWSTQWVSWNQCCLAWFQHHCFPSSSDLSLQNSFKLFLLTPGLFLSLYRHEPVTCYFTLSHKATLRVSPQSLLIYIIAYHLSSSLIDWTKMWGTPSLWQKLSETFYKLSSDHFHKEQTYYT